MFTRNIKNTFTQGLLNAVSGVLGEAKKKCSEDCECEACAPEEDETDETNEGYVSHAQRKAVWANRSDDGKGHPDKKKKMKEEVGKLGNQLKREHEAKEKKEPNGVKESKDDVPFKGPYKKAGEERKDEYGNKVKNVAKYLAKKAMNTQKEEVDQIDELSTKTLEKYKNAARADAYDADTVYDDPRFRKRAKGFMTATKKIRSNFVKGVDEAFEQIDELSKGTMGRYINKAADRMSTQGVTAGLKIAADEKSKKNFDNIAKRQKGIATAVKKLTKEEQDFIDSLNDADMEQIDEISKNAALKYLAANKKDDAKARETGDFDRMTKRMRGTDMAVRKYTAKPGSKSVRVPATEEVELDEARGRPRKAGAKDFTINPKTKEKLMHNNPEHMKKIEALQRNGVIQAPKIEANQHVMQQLQRAKLSMRGGETVNFTHGDSHHVSGEHAAKLLTKYAGMKPNEKEAFQKKIGHSHANLKSEL